MSGGRACAWLCYEAVAVCLSRDWLGSEPCELPVEIYSTAEMPPEKYSLFPEQRRAGLRDFSIQFLYIFF
jgi:hypothetical protein